MADKARMSMGVTDYGSIELRGTNEFVQNALEKCTGVVEMLLEKHIETEMAKGKSREEAAVEFDKQFRKACGAIKQLGDGNMSMSFKAGD